MKYREFIIDGNPDISGKHYQYDAYNIDDIPYHLRKESLEPKLHVIEYSAYEALEEKLRVAVEALQDYCKDRKLAHDVPGTGINYGKHYEKFIAALTEIKGGE